MNGSYGSKVSAIKNQSGAELFPERIRHIIFRKLEEFKSRGNRNGDYTLIGGGRGGGGGAAAEKRLLKEYDDDDDGNACEPMARIETEISMTTHKYNNNKEQEKVVKGGGGGGVEKNKDVIKVKADIEKSVKPQRENKHDNAIKKHDDDKEDGDDEIGRFIGPGSPSFRIYCVEPVKKKEEDKCKYGKGEMQIVAIVHKKTTSDVSVESVDSASRSSNEEATLKAVEMKPIAQSGVGMELTTTKSKAQRRKKIMSIKINMLNPKNLSIKNRINPMFSCTGSSDRNKGLFSPN